MSGRSRTKRVHAGGVVPGMRELYPSEYATGGSYNKGGGEIPRAESEREPRAVLCKQCNFPIEDYGKVQACPHCGSDNILGKFLSRTTKA